MSSAESFRTGSFVGAGPFEPASRRKRPTLSLFTLLAVSLAVVSVYVYYSCCFQIRHIEPPLDGLTYVKEFPPEFLNMFRKQFFVQIVDPAAHELHRIKEIRKATRGGTYRYPEFDQDVKEVRDNLRAIMNEARLRRIPAKFKKHVGLTLLAIQDCYYSTCLLQESFECETLEERESLYKKGFKEWRNAERQLDRSRDYFTSDEWRL
jgi:hypothetical protein